jgi:DNA polymerase-3 subunit epsilon
MQNINSTPIPTAKQNTPYQSTPFGEKIQDGRELPSMYYLDHARELFYFIENHCQHLLSSDHKSYLLGIHSLSQDAQCLLVRCLARKPKFVKLNTFNYPEISNIEEAFSELCAANYLSHAKAEDWPELSKQLTKPQLVTTLKQVDHTPQNLNESSPPLTVKSTSPKAELVFAAQSLITGSESYLESLFKEFSVRRQNDNFDYILFLFFGDLRNRFQQFAMRDLGVKRTRKADKEIARFSAANEALSAFEYQRVRQNFSQNPQNLASSTAQYLLSSKAIGQHAEKTRDKLLLSVGNELHQNDSELAMILWQRSNEPKALEKWVRSAYKKRDKEWLKIELNKLKKDNLDPTSQVFIEDFYQRKFNGKTTSIYTDMLRECSNVIGLDEAFVNTVEEGVINHYLQQGVEAHFTENKFWRVLFFLTFWELLFGPDQVQHSEFDRLPASLKDKHFYQNNKQAIEISLEIFQSSERAIQTLTKLIVKYYGQVNGGINWAPSLLDSIRVALQTHTPSSSFANILRDIAQNFKNTIDGYPDLMVVENHSLRFEEVKAPGDVLRPNQLVSINRLRDAGFEVGLAQVKWQVNPNQIYAVVDIETTGGRKGGNSITEIAVIKVRNQEIISEWSSLVNPQRHIPAHINRLTGISNSMVTDAPIFAEIADELKKQLSGTIFVAHNVGFDYSFIQSAYEAIGQPFRMPKFCTVSNSRKRFPGLRSYGLGALAEHFDIDLEGHHRALNDARATAHLLALIQNSQKL